METGLEIINLKDLESGLYNFFNFTGIGKLFDYSQSLDYTTHLVL